MSKPPPHSDALPKTVQNGLAKNRVDSHQMALLTNTGNQMTELGSQMVQLGQQGSNLQRDDIAQMLQRPVLHLISQLSSLSLGDTTQATDAVAVTPSRRKAPAQEEAVASKHTRFMIPNPTARHLCVTTSTHTSFSRTGPTPVITPPSSSDMLDTETRLGFFHLTPHADMSMLNDDLSEESSGLPFDSSLLKMSAEHNQPRLDPPAPANNHHDDDDFMATMWDDESSEPPFDMELTAVEAFPEDLTLDIELPDIDAFVEGRISGNHGQKKKTPIAKKESAYLMKVVANTNPKMTLQAYSEQNDGHLICLCGRGAHNNHHPGNQAYRDFISSQVQDYQSLSKEGKEKMTNSLVQEFKNQGRRFFKLNDNDEWEELNQESAKAIMRKKISQRFRDD